MSVNIRLVLLLIIQYSQWVKSVKKEECGYKQCPQTKDGALNVHLIPHSHMDAGWVKTFDEYYYGTRQQVSTANVQLIYHSVLSELLHDKSRKFTLSETAYFWRWWKEQRPATRAVFRKLVQEGRLEFAGGGWVQNDEATADYEAIIDCYTWGLRILNDTLGPCAKPKAAWQIDTYGHSREQTSLMAQMGFDGLFISRVNYKEREAMIEEDRLEFMWRGSDALGKMSDIMTHTLFNLYNPPEGFCFDYLCNDEPIMEEPESRSYNADKRVSEFIAQIERQAKYYNHDNIVVMMGGDFTYLSAAGWFMNMDKLINHVNNHPANLSDVNIFYSSPSCYLKAVYLYGRRDKAMYTEKGDHLPYGTDSSTYWTGYYTSRPSLKYLIRKGQQFLQILKQLSVITRSEDSYELHLLRHTVSLVHHHDAITGTSQQHVANDYLRSLTDALSSSMKKVSTLLSHLTPSWGGSRRQKSQHQFTVCHELNITQCNITENKDSMLLLLYNPSSLLTFHYVRLPAVSLGYIIKDYKDEEVEYQLLPLTTGLANLPGRKSTAQQELYFEAENIPPLGYSAFYITAVDDLMKATSLSKTDTYAEGDTERIPLISNEYIKVYINKETGMLQSIQHLNGIKIQATQNFYYYSQTQALLHSGAYSFRPGITAPVPVTEKVEYQTVKGALVKEIRQRFSDWITQTIRLYRGQEFVEFEWIVGPVPIGNDLGKEVVTRFTTNITSSDFYTDSNGRQMMQRNCWTQTSSKSKRQKKTVPACYYPITSRICINGNDTVQMCILTDRAQGGTSFNTGEIELMVHRRLLTDDEFGLDEPLNEEAHGVGLVVKGSHRIVFGHQDEQRNIDAAMKWKYEPWAFLANGEKLNRRKWSNVRNKRYSSLHAHSLPAHVHILTLEPWKTGSVLLRLENTRIANDTQAKDNGITTVDLRKIFQKQKIISVREATLSANQWLDEARQMDWSTRYVYDGDADDISLDENEFGVSESTVNRGDDMIGTEDFSFQVGKKKIHNRKFKSLRRAKRSDDEIENAINLSDRSDPVAPNMYLHRPKDIESIERNENKLNPEVLEKSRHDILKKFIYSVLSGITHFNNHFSNLYGGGERSFNINDFLNGDKNMTQIKQYARAYDDRTTNTPDDQDYDDQLTKPILDMYYKKKRPNEIKTDSGDSLQEEIRIKEANIDDKDYDTDEHKRILQYNIFSKQEDDNDNDIDNGRANRDADDNSTYTDDPDEITTYETITQLNNEIEYSTSTERTKTYSYRENEEKDNNIPSAEYKQEPFFNQDGEFDFRNHKREKRDRTGTYMPFFINLEKEHYKFKPLLEDDNIQTKIKRNKMKVKSKKFEMIEAVDSIAKTNDISFFPIINNTFEVVDIVEKQKNKKSSNVKKNKNPLDKLKVTQSKKEDNIVRKRKQHYIESYENNKDQELQRKTLDIESKIFKKDHNVNKNTNRVKNNITNYAEILTRNFPVSKSSYFINKSTSDIFQGAIKTKPQNRAITINNHMDRKKGIVFNFTNNIDSQKHVTKKSGYQLEERKNQNSDKKNKINDNKRNIQLTSSKNSKFRKEYKKFDNEIKGNQEIHKNQEEINEMIETQKHQNHKYEIVDNDTNIVVKNDITNYKTIENEGKISDHEIIMNPENENRNKEKIIKQNRKKDELVDNDDHEIIINPKNVKRNKVKIIKENRRKVEVVDKDANNVVTHDLSKFKTVENENRNKVERIKQNRKKVEVVDNDANNVDEHEVTKYENKNEDKFSDHKIIVHPEIESTNQEEIIEINPKTANIAYLLKDNQFDIENNSSDDELFENEGNKKIKTFIEYEQNDANTNDSTKHRQLKKDYKINNRIAYDFTEFIEPAKDTKSTEFKVERDIHKNENSRINKYKSKNNRTTLINPTSIIEKQETSYRQKEKNIHINTNDEAESYSEKYNQLEIEDISSDNKVIENEFNKKEKITDMNTNNVIKDNYGTIVNKHFDKRSKCTNSEIIKNQSNKNRKIQEIDDIDPNNSNTRDSINSCEKENEYPGKQIKDKTSENILSNIRENIDTNKKIIHSQTEKNSMPENQINLNQNSNGDSSRRNSFDKIYYNTKNSSSNNESYVLKINQEKNEDKYNTLDPFNENTSSQDKYDDIKLTTNNIIKTSNQIRPTIRTDTIENEYEKRTNNRFNIESHKEIQNSMKNIEEKSNKDTNCQNNNNKNNIINTDVGNDTTIKGFHKDEMTGPHTGLTTVKYNMFPFEDIPVHITDNVDYQNSDENIKNNVSKLNMKPKLTFENVRGFYEDTDNFQEETKNKNSTQLNQYNIFKEMDKFLDDNDTTSENYYPSNTFNMYDYPSIYINNKEIPVEVKKEKIFTINSKIITNRTTELNNHDKSFTTLVKEKKLLYYKPTTKKPKPDSYYDEVFNKVKMDKFIPNTAESYSNEEHPSDEINFDPVEEPAEHGVLDDEGIFNRRKRAVTKADSSAEADASEATEHMITLRPTQIRTFVIWFENKL